MLDISMTVCGLRNRTTGGEGKKKEVHTMPSSKSYREFENLNTN